MTTTAPAIPAAEITAVHDETGAEHAVVVAFETAHENVAVVRVAGRVHYQLAIHKGAWSLLPMAYPSPSAALAFVAAQVLIHFA